MTRNEEMQSKLARLRAAMDQQGWRGLVVRSRGNFAWLTGGGLSYVDASNEKGVASLLVTADRVCLLADVIESGRFRDEEIAELDIDVVDYPWHDAGAQDAAIASVVGDGVVAADLGGDPDAYAIVKALRTPLLDVEVERFRALGKVAVEVMESTCRAIRPGMTEDEVIADLLHGYYRRGVRAPVYLIAADERIARYRHPITVGKPIDKRVMVVACAERHGLWASLTRLVNFEEPDGDLKIRHRACCQVDVAANVATRPGRTLGDVFDVIAAEYDRQGFAGEWQLHHQGGSAGYAGRDDFATPGSAAPIRSGQAFAWNPSITGTKCEDTIVVTDDGFEMITEPGDDWPVIEIERDGVTMRRADILVGG